MNSNREEVLFELALDQPAGRVGALKVVQPSVNPKQALMRWSNAPAPHGADTAAAPTLGRRQGQTVTQMPLPLPATVQSSYANMSNATVLLGAAEKGDSTAPHQLLDLVYGELRRLAAYKLGREATGQTLQPTALVHEAWLKLVGAGEQKFKNHRHFFAVAAEAMRRILIDRARRRKTQRHGGQCERVELWETRLAAPAEDDQLLAVNEALEKLEGQHPAQAQVVKLRYFGGMTNEEVAQALNLSVTTVKVYWKFARAWLFDAIRNP